MRLFLRLKASPSLLQFAIHFLLSFLFGLLWFWILYNRFPLYTSHVDWIYTAGGDALQHQLGWEWFRQEPWRFPLGSIQAYGYPIGTSVTFMDSIPLLAIPFKLISPWLEAKFQYFGLWELSAVMGQMLFGMLILHQFTRSYKLKILGASLLVLSSPMIFRAFYHNSLSAHWILLAAIWFALLEYRGRAWRGAWILLFAVAILIQLYYIPMLLPLWLVGLYFRYQREKKPWTILLEIIGVVLVLLLLGFSIGLFDLHLSALSSTGFGTFTWNLNGFFNPFHFSSTYLKGMATGNSGQYEGFSYLGLGLIMALPASLYVFFLQDPARRKWRVLLPFAAASVVYIFVALSHKAFFNDLALWDLNLPDWALQIFNLFRASGRFIWPVFYLLVLFILLSVIRNIRYPALILLLVLLLQLSDLRPLYESKQLNDVVVYASRLEGDFWQAAAETNEHVIVLPAKKLTLEYEPLALYAAHNQLTINIGYFARSDERAFEEYANEVWKALNNHQIDARTMFVITNLEWLKTARANLSDEMLICKVDDFNVLLSAQNEITQSNVDLFAYCSVPTP